MSSLLSRDRTNTKKIGQIETGSVKNLGKLFVGFFVCAVSSRMGMESLKGGGGGRVIGCTKLSFEKNRLKQNSSFLELNTSFDSMKLLKKS